MLVSDFQNRLSDPNIPTFIRDIAQKAISKLRVDFDGTIEVSEEHFAKLCKHARIEPIKSSAFKFIRIEDEECNSVDIQTPVDFMAVCAPYKF